MINFIKLTSVIINSLKINRIDILSNKYCIHLIDDKFSGLWLFTSGTCNSNKDVMIEICKEKNPIDYKILTDWINKIN